MKEAVILIPSYEPDELLINTINELIENDFPILLVNDGSGKEYDKIFDQIKDKVTYLSYNKNHGKGYAMKYGYARLLGLFPEVKFVITADGDGQHKTEDIIRVYEELVKYNHLVFGTRHFDGKVPFRSRFGNDFSKITRSLLTKTYIADDQCGLRGFPVRYIPDLLKIKGSRYEYEMNQIVRFQMKQYPLITIPIETVYLDNNTRSHFSPFKDTFRIQTIIFMHAIGSILLFALNLFLMMHWIASNIFNWPYICTIVLSYSITFSLYVCYLCIFYSSSNFWRRFLKELMFAGIHIVVVNWFVDLFITNFNISPFIILPIAAVSACTFNVFLAWALRKLFKTF